MIGRRLVINNYAEPSTTVRGATEREPQQEPSVHVADDRRHRTRYAFAVRPREGVPIREDRVAHIVGPGVDHIGARKLRVFRLVSRGSEEEKGFAQMENRLLPEAKFSNGLLIGSFAAQAHVNDGAGMLIAKDAVVQADECGAEEEWVDGVCDAVEQGEFNCCRAGVVGVLDQLFEHRKTVAVTVAKIVRDQVHIGEWVVPKAGQFGLRAGIGG
jgi:hypothetical protein